MSADETRLLAVLVLGVLLSMPLPSYAQTILIQETFEDTNLGGRGWYDYDLTQAGLSTTEKYAGTRSHECRFAVGGTSCAAGIPARHPFQETDSVYVSFYIKHSTNWVGSGKSYHPHMFHFLTNLDGAYIGLAYTHLTTYVEENGGVPLVAIQDGMNVDESRIGVDLTNTTEQRSVGGCNGDSDGYGNGDCYLAGTAHRNGKTLWSAPQVLFDSTSGSPTYKGSWHLIEAYFKLNGIVAGKGTKDGIVRYWYDGKLMIDRSNVVFRTAAKATMKFNQLDIAPYIGDGSPVDQAYWIDNLLMATARPASPPTPPGSGALPPSAPINLRIVR